MKLKIEYNEPENNDTCIVVCYFSPVGYYKPLQNIKYVLGSLKEAKIPYVLIELLYPGQNSCFQESIVVKSNSIIFSKENLWNIAEKYVPDRYSKLLFLDSDILFDQSDWFDKTSELLDHNDIIQPMEYACRDIDFDNIYSQEYDPPLHNRSICRHPVAKAIKDKTQIILGLHQPGFAIGINRNFFHNTYGFYEYAITGNNDVLFWLSIIDFDSSQSFLLLEKIPEAKKQYEVYKKRMQKYIKHDRIDYIKDNIGLHTYHGTESNRFYSDRNRYIPEQITFFHNEYGVLEITSKEHKDLKQYWIDRKEDE